VLGAELTTQNIMFVAEMLRRANWLFEGSDEVFPEVKYRLFQKELYNCIPNVTVWRTNNG
jgi:hypothetical protein